MIPIHIRSEFFTAGAIYGWEGSPMGIGIEISQYRGEGDIAITIGNSKRVLLLDKAEAREFIKEHRSIFNARGTRLGVVKRSMFKDKLEGQKVLI